MMEEILELLCVAHVDIFGFCLAGFLLGTIRK